MNDMDNVMNTEYITEAWYKVNYTISDAPKNMEFLAYKIQSICDLVIKDSTCSSNPEIKGYMKWDGCLEFEQNSHYCDIEHAEQTLMLFKRLYEIAKQNGFDL